MVGLSPLWILLIYFSEFVSCRSSRNSGSVYKSLLLHFIYTISVKEVRLKGNYWQGSPSKFYREQGSDPISLNLVNCLHHTGSLPEYFFQRPFHVAEISNASNTTIS